MQGPPRRNFLSVRAWQALPVLRMKSRTALMFNGLTKLFASQNHSNPRLSTTAGLLCFPAAAAVIKGGLEACAALSD